MVEITDALEYEIIGLHILGAVPLDAFEESLWEESPFRLPEQIAPANECLVRLRQIELDKPIFKLC